MTDDVREMRLSLVPRFNTNIYIYICKHTITYPYYIFGIDFPSVFWTQGCLGGRPWFRKVPWPWALQTFDPSTTSYYVLLCCYLLICWILCWHVVLCLCYPLLSLYHAQKYHPFILQEIEPFLLNRSWMCSWCRGVSRDDADSNPRKYRKCNMHQHAICIKEYATIGSISCRSKSPRQYIRIVSQ